MVFRRRTKRSLWQVLVASLYPKGGWRRAISYVGHRLSRLPDSPERIARGVAAGTFVSFTPLFGFHFILAALIARGLRGNIMAGLLGTFFGNPISFPFIVIGSVELGNLILGQGGIVHFPQIMASFGFAWEELWRNFVALFTGAPQEWGRLALFFRRVFLPYAVGGILPGIACGIAMYYISLPVIRTYQKRRRAALRTRFMQSRMAQAEGGSPGQDEAAGNAPEIRRGPDDAGRNAG